MLKKLTLLFFVLSISLLSGCATVALSPQNAKRIHTIHVNEKVQLPEKMIYRPSAIGDLFGGIGVLVQYEIDKSPGKQMELFAKQHHIFIDQIVRNQFIKQLSAKTSFKVVSSNNADAKLNIEIIHYGLSVPGAISHGMDPFLTVRANLTDKQNQIVWQNEDSVVPLSPGTTAHTAAAIKKNPQLLFDSWNQAANRAVSSIVNTLPHKS